MTVDRQEGVAGRESAPGGSFASAHVAGRAWTVAAEVVERRCTTSAAALHALRSPVVERLDAHLQDEERFLDEGRALADALFDVIGEAVADRKALVGLRRALHRGRRPGEREREALRAADADLEGQVGRWCERHGRLRSALQDLQGPLDDELAGDLARLATAASEPLFLHGLGVAAPDLAADVRKALADPTRRVKLGKRLRLAKFLARAAAKTSPYSSFLVAEMAAWDGAGGARPVLARQLDQGTVDALVAAVATEARAEGVAAAALNPTLRFGPDLVAFFVATRETALVLPLDDALRRWLALPCWSGETDVDRVRADAAAAGLDAADLDALVGAGVVETAIGVDDLDPDPVGALARWLRGQDPRWAQAWQDRLEPLASGLRREGAVDGGGGVAELTRVAGEVTASVTPSDADASDGWGVQVHEVLVGGGGAGPRLGEWQDRLDDLAVATRWLSRFSWKHPVRIAFGAWFGDRFGSGADVPLVDALRAAHADVARPQADLGPAAQELQFLLPARAMPWFLDVTAGGVPRIHAYGRLRAAAAAPIEAWRPGPGREEGVVLSARRLATDLDRDPPWLPGPTSRACYLQEVPGRSDLVVLNAMHLGLGRARARHAGLVGAPFQVRPDDADVLHAELAGSFGSSMNGRPPTLPFVVDLPGTVTTRPVEERLLPRDLVVRHDAATDLAVLWSPRHDRQVVPVHLGMMGEMGLAPLASFLERFFSPGFVVHPSVPVLGAATLLTLDDVRREPRVTIGTVVVQRARWTVPAGDLPVRTGHRASVEDLARVSRWRREHEVPEVCFARVWAPDQHTHEHKSRKPFLVDFRSWYGVEMLLQHVVGAQVVVLEEALPNPLEQVPASGCVTELMVEIEDRPRGRRP